MNHLDEGILLHEEKDLIAEVDGCSEQDVRFASYAAATGITPRSSASTFSMSSMEPTMETSEQSVFSDELMRLADSAPRNPLYLTSMVAPPTQGVEIWQPYQVRNGSCQKTYSSARPSHRMALYSFDSVSARPWPALSRSPSSSRHSSTSRATRRAASRLQQHTIASRFSADSFAMPEIFTCEDVSMAPQMSLSRSTADASDNSHLLSSVYENWFPPSSLPSVACTEDIFNSIPSNADIQSTPLCIEHHCPEDTSAVHPPDLFTPLSNEPELPPAEDMDPTDPELRPREQDIRFVGDLYTPRWIRGHGNKREGWCGICQPGRWLVLKNSAFWYDKSFGHGVSAATGMAFDGPKETRRVVLGSDSIEGGIDGGTGAEENQQAELWEGLCHGCGEWIALRSNKRKGTTWFRHAYKVSVCLPLAPLLHSSSHMWSSYPKLVADGLWGGTVPHSPQGQRRPQETSRDAPRQTSSERTVDCENARRIPPDAGGHDDDLEQSRHRLTPSDARR